VRTATVVTFLVRLAAIVRPMQIERRGDARGDVRGDTPTAACAAMTRDVPEAVTVLVRLAASLSDVTTCSRAGGSP